MTHAPGKYADFEGLRERAVALRRAGLSRRQIRDRLHVDNNDLLNRLLEGEPAPAWTKRPNAKDDLREKARALRLQGCTTRSRWSWGARRVRSRCGYGICRSRSKRSTEEASAIARRGWEVTLQRREEERQHTKAVAQQAVGDLTDREVFLAGVALYWAEGAKDKSYSRRERLHFINSDPNVISFFLRWLDALGVERERLRFRVSIHESANVQGAEEFWAGLAGVAPATFQKATLKKHNPKTSRKNTSEAYRGCLIVYVLKSADLYRRMEGAWYGIVGGATRRPD
jgi:hypothetical protein